MTTTAPKTAPKTPASTAVLHEQPPGFEPQPGKKIGVGDAVYDPTTGVHTITRFDPTPRYVNRTGVAAYRRAHDHTTTWTNPIFDTHTYLARLAPREHS